MAATQPETTPTDRVGFRDIYAAVGASEERIIAAFERTTGPLIEQGRDHEDRLRAFETGDIPWLVRVMEGFEKSISAQGTRIGDLENEVGNVKTDVNGFKSRERWIVGTLGGGRQVLLTAGSVVGIALGLAGLVALVTN